MFGPCPVVKIKYDNAEGFCEINESDFNPEIHKLSDEQEAPKRRGRPVKAEQE